MTEEEIKDLAMLTSKLSYTTNRQFFLNKNTDGIIELCVAKNDHTPVTLFTSKNYTQMLLMLHTATKCLFIAGTDGRTPLNNRDREILKDLNLGEDTDWRVI